MFIAILTYKKPLSEGTNTLMRIAGILPSIMLPVISLHRDLKLHVSAA